jgi:hypothetical protein
MDGLSRLLYQRNIAESLHRKIQRFNGKDQSLKKLKKVEERQSSSSKSPYVLERQEFSSIYHKYIQDHRKGLLIEVRN